MRVERLEHAADGAVHEPVGFHLADVIRLDGVHGGGKHPVLVGNLVLGEGASAKQAAHERADDDDKEGGGGGPVLAHI